MKVEPAPGLAFYRHVPAHHRAEARVMARPRPCRRTCAWWRHRPGGTARTAADCSGVMPMPVSATRKQPSRPLVPRARQRERALAR